jgi:hypothetical protein
MNTILELDRPKTEDELVLEWRVEQLARAGYDDRAAGRLAALPHVDLHVAVDLLRNGCPADTALRILV